MLEIHHFTYGWVTPVIAYIMSVTGSLLGLQCAARARATEKRAGWLVAAAVAIGGTGIWVMHFIAMLGFSIDGATIRYDVPLTLFSAVLSMFVVWLGISTVMNDPKSWWRLLAGGAITGSGVAIMHYSGMYAMKTDASVGYSVGIVTVSAIIAVVAATVALWFTLNVKGMPATVGAALIMGVAVCGMHYTGMSAMSAHRMDDPPLPHGAGAMQLLAPLMLIVSTVTIVLLIYVGLTDIEDVSAAKQRADAIRARAQAAKSDPKGPGNLR
ncbi:MHYT domain-containing protein [Nocardia stercoris]|uniref:MHYT domain-containing protein n=1 Tax=Nocardia stercoris TaxID=2483361 RepID=A0A3M2KYF1_9NOCA|nr:MHYT domain-containing protein [Nocardia stercoris]RMI30084.1 hypothetical protein EBN03_22915 [Nocardia stercoris]